MIKIYKILGDHLTQIDELSDIDLAKDVFWIDLVSPSLEEDNLIEDFLKISIPTRQDMQGIELSSQFYDDNSARYMTISAVAQMHLDNPLRTPVTFIIREKGLVTIRYEELMPISNYVAKAKRQGGVATPVPEAIMFDVLEALINRIADSLEILGGDIDGISRDIFRSKKISTSRKTLTLQSSIRKIGAKGDLLSMLRESLSSFSRFVSHYEFDAAKPETKILKSKLGGLNKDILSLSDHAGFLSGKMNFLLDATLGLINLEQNQIIKIFSIAAVVFLPPTLVATIYGMNFKDMPELGWPYAYPISLLVMVVSGIIPLVYFKRKGWL